MTIEEKKLLTDIILCISSLMSILKVAESLMSTLK
jgi:hypothetical protein